LPGLSELEATALLLSLRVAFWSTLLSLPLGLGCAFLLARGRFPGKGALNGIVHLPLILPPVVVGYVLLLLFGRHGPLGAWLEAWFGLTFVFSWRGAALASAVMGFPLMVRAMRLSLEAVDRGLEQAARTLGAAPARVFFGITLPLMAPGILTGTVLAFARSFGEFGATITFVSNIPGETRTLPLALYTVTQTPGGDAQALRLTVISLAAALLALFASEWAGQRVERRIRGEA
jgi:molybdate transport system permease protein